jgi:pimeloyl-ACP methyl ester carboxylesterase
MTSRRNLLAGSLAAAAATTLPSAPARAQGKPRTFVLIHGAWHGGWCWSRVADILTAHGHRVFAPSLTGLADRSHLLSTSINLDTHIADIVNLFTWEDLHDAILVAHSYGGWPVSGALEKIHSRVSSVVFLDAFMPADGERGLDLSSQQFQAALREAVARGEAGRPVPPASAFRIRDPRDAAWVTERMTPQPVGVAMQTIRLSGARDKVARKTYIRAPAYPQPSFDAYLARCKADPTWKTFVFPPEEAGHDVMVDAPARLARILEDVA